MRFLLQLSLLFTLTIIGGACSAILPFPFPSALIAMLLLLILLGLKIVKEEQLTETSSFFAKYMAMFFLPSSVEIIENLDVLRSVWVELIVISIVSLFITFFVAAKAVEITERLIGRKAK